MRITTFLLAATTVLGGTFGLLASAEANAHHAHKYKSHRYASGYDDRRYRYDDKRAYKHKREHKKKHSAKHDRLRLDLPVHLRGNDELKIRRALNRHYDIDLDHYRLRKVVFDHHGRRPGAAAVRVGYRWSSPQRLHRGRNEIYAPHDGDGNWRLGVQGARIDTVRVVLEPRYSRAYAHRGYRR